MNPADEGGLIGCLTFTLASSKRKEIISVRDCNKTLSLTRERVIIMSSLLLFLLTQVGGESGQSVKASPIAELTPPPSAPFNATGNVNATTPFNNTSTFGQVPFEPLPQQPLPQQPLPQQPLPQQPLGTQDRIQEILNTVLTTNTSSTDKTFLLDQLEQSIENLTSNQYDVTAEATEDENGGESYLINIERIVDDPVIAGEEEEGNGDEEDGGNGDEEDGGNGDEEDGGNGDEEDGGNGDEGSQVIQPFLPSSLVEAN
jgi:hypothetical protein